MAIKKATTTKKIAKKIPKAKLTAPVIPVLAFEPLVTTTKKPKKPVTKKAGVKSAKVGSGSAGKSSKKPEVIVVEEVTLGAKESLKLPFDVSKEYIIVHRCTNCEHIPFSLTKLVTLFSVLIMLLSVSVLVQVGTIDVSKLGAFVAPIAQAIPDFTTR